MSLEGDDFLLWFTQKRNMVVIVNIFIRIILLKRLHNVDTFLRLFHFTYAFIHSARCTFETTEGRENRIKNDFGRLMSCVMAGVFFVVVVLGCF